MSLAIDIDKVSDVLLADGWHHVEFAKVRAYSLSTRMSF